MRVYRIAFGAMGGPCELQLASPNEQTASLWAQNAIAEVRRIEGKYSRYRTDSVVSQINLAAGISPVRVDAETWALLEYAHQLFLQSLGLFDITSGVLRRAWNFKSTVLPSEENVNTAKSLVGWPQVERASMTVYLPHVGMEIDFGGFGKEYAADRAAALLRQKGVQHGMINLSGDIHVIGPKFNGNPWVLGIQHPRDPAKVLAHLSLSSGALATSGDYERYLEVGGRRYCHLLNPKSGWPVNYWQSVSVLAPNALLAGSLSTLTMLMESAGIKLLQDSEMDFLAVGLDGQIVKKGTIGQHIT